MAQAGASSAQPKPGFQARRVLGSPPAAAPATARTGYAAVPAAPPPSPAQPRRGLMQPTRPRITTTSLFGLALIFLCVLGIVLNAVLPWLWVKSGAVVVGLNSGASAGAPSGGEATTLDKGEMEDAFDHKNTDYVADLVSWPLFTFVFGLIAGVFLLFVDLVPMVVGLQRGLQGFFLLVASFFGFLLTLTGFRWLGLMVVQSMDSGDAQFTLHVVPYLNLVLGLIVLGGSWVLLKGLIEQTTAQGPTGQFGPWGVRVPAWTLAVAGASLLLLPMLPFATQQVESFEEKDAIGEADLALLKEAGNEDQKKPAENLATARLMLWLTLWFALAALAFGIAERSGSQPLLWGILTQLYGLVVVPLIVGVIFIALFYTNLPKMAGDSEFSGLSVGYSLNWFPVVSYLALAGLFLVYAGRVLMPFVRGRLAEGQSGAGASTRAAPPLAPPPQ